MKCAKSHYGLIEVETKEEFRDPIQASKTLFEVEECHDGTYGVISKNRNNDQHYNIITLRLC